jgi:hypothetical protein
LIEDILQTPSKDSNQALKDPKPVGEYKFSELAVPAASYTHFSTQMPSIQLAPGILYRYTFHKGIEYHGNDPRLDISNKGYNLKISNTKRVTLTKDEIM